MREHMYLTPPTGIVEPEQGEVGDMPSPAGALSLGRNSVDDQIATRSRHVNLVSRVCRTQQMHVVTCCEQGRSLVLDTDVRWEGLRKQHEDPHGLPPPLSDT